MSQNTTSPFTPSPGEPVTKLYFEKSVWECKDWLEQFKDDDGEKRWKCHWCGYTGAQHNATKALKHVAALKGDSKKCTAVPAKYRDAFRDLQRRKNESKVSAKSSKQGRTQDVDMHNDDAAVALDARKPAQAKRRKLSERNTIHRHLSRSVSSAGSHVTPLRDLHQMKIDQVDPSLDSRMDMAVANLIHCEGTAFSLADSAHLRKIIQLAKCVSKNYVPPNRNRIAGELLELNYHEHYRKDVALLMVDSEIYGLDFYGDGATIKSMPLLNIMAYGVHAPAVILDIVDCTGHVSAGKKKDGPFVAREFVTHMQVLDPNKSKFDAGFFDGASDVGLAGRIIEARFPKCTAMHGAEHVVSLFFSDLAKIPLINDVIKIYQQHLYAFFGSGARHKEHGMFIKHATNHNNGRKIGLLRASACRMGGYFIALLRMIRQKPAFESLVISPEFRELNVGRIQVELLRNADWWRFCTLLCKTVFPALLLLRLTDNQHAAMDKLLYHVFQVDRFLEDNKDELSQLGVNDLTFRTYAKKAAKDIDESGQAGEVTVPEAEEDEEEAEFDCEAEDESDSDDEDGGADEWEFLTGDSMYDRIRKAWGKRRRKLIHGYSILGYLLSPVAEIMADAANPNNLSYDMKEQANTVILKLLDLDSKTAEAEALNTFWTELRNFQSKKDPWAKEWIWMSPDIAEDRSWLWHRNHSYGAQVSKVLGIIACRVTSKKLGMGQAERCWGAVKDLKNHKRSHMGAKATKYQTHIYARDSQQKAILKRQLVLQAGLEASRTVWTDRDLAAIGRNRYGIDIVNTVCARVTRRFRCWLEDWEPLAMANKDIVSRVRLEEKYCGISWWDPDDEVYVTIPKEDKDAKEQAFVFERCKNEGHQWVLHAYTEDKVKFRHYLFQNQDIYPQIYHNYKQNPISTLEVVHPGVTDIVAGVPTDGARKKWLTYPATADQDQGSSGASRQPRRSDDQDQGSSVARRPPQRTVESSSSDSSEEERRTRKARKSRAGNKEMETVVLSSNDSFDQEEEDDDDDDDDEEEKNKKMPAVDKDEDDDDDDDDDDEDEKNKKMPAVPTRVWRSNRLNMKR